MYTRGWSNGSMSGKLFHNRRNAGKHGGYLAGEKKKKNTSGSHDSLCQVFEGLIHEKG